MTIAMFNQAAHAAPVYTVRFSTAADIPAIQAYYAGNRHQHVDKKDDAKIAKAAKDGRYLLVLDTDGAIGFSSGSYDYHLGAAHKATWIEIGSTRARLEGMGLYPFIIASQVVHEFLTRPPRECFMASIYSDNTTVSAMLEKKVGWTPFAPEDALIDLTGDRALHEGGRLAWLRVESHSLPHQARIVLDMMNRAETTGILNRKTGEQATFDLSSFPLATHLRPWLEEIAHGAFGKKLETAPHKPLRALSHALQRPKPACNAGPKPGLG